VRDFDKQEKWLFSICHGIQVLAAAGLTKGKNVTCYEHVKFEVESTGGKWIDKQAVRDGRMVTGQTWQSHPDFYREVMELSYYRDFGTSLISNNFGHSLPVTNNRSPLAS